MNPFEAVNAYVKQIMQNAVTVQVDPNKPQKGWITHVFCFKPEVRVKHKFLHRSVEQAEYEVREVVCNLLAAGKGLPEVC